MILAFYFTILKQIYQSLILLVHVLGYFKWINWKQTFLESINKTILRNLKHVIYGHLNNPLTPLIHKKGTYLCNKKAWNSVLSCKGCVQFRCTYTLCVARGVHSIFGGLCWGKGGDGLKFLKLELMTVVDCGIFSKFWVLWMRGGGGLYCPDYL